MQPVQLRLGFSQPSRPVTLRLSLSGLTVLVDTQDGLTSEAWAYLSGAGVEPTQAVTGELSFPVAKLTSLVNLPQQVTTLSEEAIRSLVTLVEFPSLDGAPAELSVDPDGSMWLRWHDGTQEWTEQFHPGSAAALLTAEIPFVATQAGFEALRAACQLPLLVGRCRLNRDGFIEVTTSKPQLVEAAPLTGLFRLDETHYGVPLPYIDCLDSAPGFVWEGFLPRLERGPAKLPPMPMPLSAHAAADLRTLVDSLAAYGTQAIVWDSGLGRRVFALAAIEALDAWPTLVVCAPSALWVWQRHVEMFSRTVALFGGGGGDADVQLMTYEEFSRRPNLGSPQAVIFDDMTDPAASGADVAAAVVSLGGLVDAYRIGIARGWPQTPKELNAAMSMLRPGEFQADLPVFDRYPADSVARLREHAACYVSQRRAGDPGRDETEFRRSSVVPLEVPRALKQELDALRTRSATEAVILAEELEVCSAGSKFVLSPKIAEAVSRAQTGLDDGRRVAVLTRHRRTESLLRGLLRAYAPQTADMTSSRVAPQHRLVLVRFERELPDLRWFDEVIVVDYPWSVALLDAAVGPPTSEDGPLRVTCLHLTGTLDDRLAELAARRRELGAVIDQSGPPTPAEISYLVGAAPRP